MDLRHDWKALNDVLFYSNDVAVKTNPHQQALVLLQEKNRIIDGIVYDGSEFAEKGLENLVVNKEALDNLAAKYQAQEVMVVDKELLDQSIIEAASLGTNYFQQLELMRSRILESRTSAEQRRPSTLVVSRKHFILDLLANRLLGKVLPRKFNVVIFIDERQNLKQPLHYKSILLSYNHGQLDQFYEPDFSSLHENRLEHWPSEMSSIGQYLENRYILPCYALFLDRNAWVACNQEALARRSPWGMFADFCEQGKIQVYPKNWITNTIVASQRLMGFFHRKMN